MCKFLYFRCSKNISFFLAISKKSPDLIKGGAEFKQPDMTHKKKILSLKKTLKMQFFLFLFLKKKNMNY